MGTASTERQPSRNRISRWGSSSACARSGTSSGRRASAVRPTSVDSRSIVIARSCSSRSRLLPKAARTWNESLDSSYSMIDPPSVPVSRTALLTIWSRTSSRSRLEPTASPTSRRASSWATLLASSALLDSSARIRSTCRNTIAPSNGELLEELAFAHVEGRDFGAPHGQHADDLVLQDHRRGEQGAKTGKPLEVVASVLRVAEHVGNLMGTPVLGRAPDGGRTVPGNRVVQQVLAILLRDLAGDPRETEHVALEEEQLSGLRSAQSRGVFDDGVEYVAGVGGVAAERRQDLAARRGLLAGVSQLLALRGQTLDRSSSARPRSLLHRRTRSARRVFARIDHSSLRAGLISVCALTVDGAGPLAISTPPGHTRVLGRMVFAFSTNSMRSHTPVVSCARSR